MHLVEELFPVHFGLMLLCTTQLYKRCMHPTASHCIASHPIPPYSIALHHTPSLSMALHYTHPTPMHCIPPHCTPSHPGWIVRPALGRKHPWGAATPDFPMGTPPEHSHTLRMNHPSWETGAAEERRRSTSSRNKSEEGKVHRTDER